MRLKVNGVEVRVIDRIEIILEVAEEGDTLLNGVDVRVTGGPLTVNQGSHPIACFHLHHDSVMTLNSNEFTPGDISNLPR